MSFYLNIIIILIKIFNWIYLKQWMLNVTNYKLHCLCRKYLKDKFNNMVKSFNIILQDKQVRCNIATCKSYTNKWRWRYSVFDQRGGKLWLSQNSPYKPSNLLVLSTLFGYMTFKVSLFSRLSPSVSPELPIKTSDLLRRSARRLLSKKAFIKTRFRKSKGFTVLELSLCGHNSAKCSSIVKTNLLLILLKKSSLIIYL